MTRLTRVLTIARESAVRRRNAGIDALLSRVRDEWNDPRAVVEGNGSEVPLPCDAAEAAHWYAVCVRDRVVATGPSRHAALLRALGVAC